MVPSVVDSDLSSRTILFSTPIVISFTIIIIVICFTIPQKEAVTTVNRSKEMSDQTILLLALSTSNTTKKNKCSGLASRILAAIH